MLKVLLQTICDVVKAACAQCLLSERHQLLSLGRSIDMKSVCARRCIPCLITRAIEGLALDAALTKSLCVHADDLMNTVRHMQEDAICAQALTTAARGQWCKDLDNTRETLVADLGCLRTGGMWPTGLLTEIHCCFEVSQVPPHRHTPCV